MLSGPNSNPMLARPLKVEANTNQWGMVGPRLQASVFYALFSLLILVCVFHLDIVFSWNCSLIETISQKSLSAFVNGINSGGQKLNLKQTTHFIFLSLKLDSKKLKLYYIAPPKKGTFLSF